MLWTTAEIAVIDHLAAEKDRERKASYEAEKEEERRKNPTDGLYTRGELDI